MNTTQFFVQDVAGNAYAVRVAGHLPKQPRESSPSQGEVSMTRTYMLEDGSALARVDNDTFQMVDTGAYLTLLRD